MGLYSIKNLFTKQPVAIASAVRTVLYVAVLGGVLQIDVPTLAGVALALEVVLSLFAYSTSTPTASPTLAAYTQVTNPAAPGGDTPPPDLIVAPKNLVMTPTEAAEARVAGRLDR